MTQLRHTFAALYLAYVLTHTHGPYSLFKTARDALPHGGLLTCFFCLVFWCALALHILPRFVVDALTVAGGASALYKYTGLGYDTSA